MNLSKFSNINTVHKYKRYRNRRTSRLKYKEKQFSQRPITDDKIMSAKSNKQTKRKQKQDHQTSGQFIVNNKVETGPVMIAKGVTIILQLLDRCFFPNKQ